MVTTQQKPVSHTQKIKRKETKHTITVNYNGREQKEKKGTEELQNSQKTINKMPKSIYLSIITLNVNRLNFPIKRQSG